MQSCLFTFHRGTNLEHKKSEVLWNPESVHAPNILWWGDVGWRKQKSYWNRIVIQVFIQDLSSSDVSYSVLASIFHPTPHFFLETCSTQSVREENLPFILKLHISPHPLTTQPSLPPNPPICNSGFRAEAVFDTVGSYWPLSMQF